MNQLNKSFNLTLSECRKLVSNSNYIWKDQASCLGLDSTKFIYDDNLQGKNQLKVYKESIKICKQCPVRPECLAYSLNAHTNDGVWGGLIPSQRKGLKYFSTMREIFKNRDK